MTISCKYVKKSNFNSQVIQENSDYHPALGCGEVVGASSRPLGGHVCTNYAPLTCTLKLILGASGRSYFSAKNRTYQLILKKLLSLPKTVYTIIKLTFLISNSNKNPTVLILNLRTCIICCADINVTIHTFINKQVLMTIWKTEMCKKLKKFQNLESVCTQFILKWGQAKH